MPCADPTLVSEVLEEYSALTRTWMGRYLPDREPRRYLYDLAADYPARGGRGLRPTLCIANARAFGASEQAAVRTAVAIELMHNAMLVHDDVEDESLMRRGKPTLHEQHGVPLAVNAGDMLMALSFEPLMENLNFLNPALSLRLLKETHRMARESAEGQAIELGWRADNLMDLTEGDYYRMVAKKTCWLTTIHPLRTGGLIGGTGAAHLAGFIRLGFFLGNAFQIQDDILNLAGDMAEYGKEFAGDIGEGKRTLMLIRLINCLPADERDRLREILAMDREARGCHSRWVLERMAQYHCIEYARQVASAFSGAASVEFARLYDDLPPSRDRDFIRHLIYWVIERS